MNKLGTGVKPLAPGQAADLLAGMADSLTALPRKGERPVGLAAVTTRTLSLAGLTARTL